MSALRTDPQFEMRSRWAQEDADQTGQNLNTQTLAMKADALPLIVSNFKAAERHHEAAFWTDVHLDLVARIARCKGGSCARLELAEWRETMAGRAGELSKAIRRDNAAGAPVLSDGSALARARRNRIPGFKAPVSMTPPKRREVRAASAYVEAASANYTPRGMGV